MDFDGATVKAVALNYRSHVQEQVDPPAGRDRAAAEMKVCTVTEGGDGAPYVSTINWSLTTDDGEAYQQETTGYDGYPIPAFAPNDIELHSGRCTRGWVTFDITTGAAITDIGFGADGPQTFWKVK